MAIRFVGIDPETPGGNCPAVYVDDATGDLLIQGWTITDLAELAAMAEHSPLLPNETIVRLPARMLGIVREACERASAFVR
ncbi:hypothetical protein [Actinomadura hibisca]|uniref:hypothetical protein n=1 Tax=Actinomadura hibisca TaxID=68565 RepID=UPI000830D204|nr:hypothetical protein [Actinomadura hibisca]